MLGVDESQGDAATVALSRVAEVGKRACQNKQALFKSCYRYVSQSEAGCTVPAQRPITSFLKACCCALASAGLQAAQASAGLVAKGCSELTHRHMQGAMSPRWPTYQKLCLASPPLCASVCASPPPLPPCPSGGLRITSFAQSLTPFHNSHASAMQVETSLEVSTLRSTCPAVSGSSSSGKPGLSRLGSRNGSSPVPPPGPQLGGGTSSVVVLTYTFKVGMRK